MIYNEKHDLVCETSAPSETEARDQARRLCDAIATHASQKARGGVVCQAAIDWA